jgi:hypothetical protein
MPANYGIWLYLALVAHCADICMLWVTLRAVTTEGHQLDLAQAAQNQQ